MNCFRCSAGLATDLTYALIFAAALTACGANPPAAGSDGALQSDAASWPAQSNPRQASSSEEILYRFSGPDGAQPAGGVVFGKGDKLYGTTFLGGANSLGTVFELSPSPSGWTEQVVHSFGPLSDGQNPLAAVVFDRAGALFGATPNGGSGRQGLVYELSRNGSSWTYTIVHAFQGPDGSNPESGVILHSKDIYGTTAAGGPGGASGAGILFELIPSGSSWMEKRLHVFQSGGKAPSYPEGGLVRDPAGNLYGTSTYGGALRCRSETCGTVYEAKPGSHGLHTIYALKGGSDGQNPTYGLTRDASGNLYGTTSSTVFELTPGNGDRWKESVLYSFPPSGGSGRIGEVAVSSAGAIYGVTDFGGDSKCFTNGCGVVFSLARTSSGWTYTVLHTFTGGTDGAFPNGPLVLDAQGNLYGTTSGGDDAIDFGTVFKITLTSSSQRKNEKLP